MFCGSQVGYCNPPNLGRTLQAACTAYRRARPPRSTIFYAGGIPPSPTNRIAIAGSLASRRERTIPSILEKLMSKDQKHTCRPGVGGIAQAAPRRGVKVFSEPALDGHPAVSQLKFAGEFAL